MENGSQNGVQQTRKIAFGGFRTHLGRPRSRKRRFKNGSKIGPEKRRLLDREDARPGGMCGALGLCSWQISSKILPGISHARPLRGRRIQSLRAFRQARVEGIRTKRKSIESLPFKRFGLVGNSMKVCTWGCLKPQILRKSSFVSPRVSQNEPYDTQGGPE